MALIPLATWADHAPPTTPIGGLPVDQPVINEGAVRFIKNVQAAGRPTAAPFGETPPIVRDGKTYRVHSSSTYGLHVLDVTDPLNPTVVVEYNSAFGCADAYASTVPTGQFGPLTPLGGFENDLAMTNDGTIAILGMDDTGRCHDPQDGGLEFVDLSDITKPRTLHLLRNVGMAHGVTVDPVRPWLAYTSTSDSQDMIDIVDFRSCLGGVARINECKPEVARIDLDAEYMPGLKIPGATGRDKAQTGCHDLRFRGDRAYCAAIDSTLILDTSGVLDAEGNLTGSKLTSGPNACRTIPAERAPGVSVTDCSNWSQKLFKDQKSLAANVTLVSVIVHDGSKPPGKDIDIAHQAEAIGDGTIMIVTDERGGGLSNSAGCPGGGAWFYDIRDEKNPKLMRQPDGSPGVFITKFNPPEPIRSSPSCTIHYGSEFADENLLVFAWYMAGTRVVRYEADFTTTPATITFDEVAAYLPSGAMTIQSLGAVRNPANPEELVIYTSDAVRGIDVLGVSLPKVLRKAAIKLPSRATSSNSDGGQAGPAGRPARPRPPVYRFPGFAQNNGVVAPPVRSGIARPQIVPPRVFPNAPNNQPFRSLARPVAALPEQSDPIPAAVMLFLGALAATGVGLLWRRRHVL